MELIWSGVEWCGVIHFHFTAPCGSLQRSPAAPSRNFIQRPMRWDVLGLFGCPGGSLLSKALGAALRSACGRARAKLFGVVLNGPERS